MASETYTMEYGNASWLNQLTKVTYTDVSGNASSQSLRYDQMGNPTRYFNGHGSWNFTWKYGRQLANATNGSRNISYTYDMDGIRQSKTVNGNTTSYTTLDGKVVREANGNVTTDYFYDNEGKPYKIVVTNNTTSYEGYYVLNQQGDVTAILDAYGNVAVSYDYNAWGKILSESGSSTIQSMYLQSHNHLKYRGYYQDAETGFYYLDSRYYDPAIGRFINADKSEVLTVNPTPLVDKNLYTYCDNNPVVRRDTGGAIWETVFDIVSLGASIMDVATNPKDPWAWAGLIGDAIDLIPVVTGAGEVIRGLKTVNKIDDISDAAKIANRTENVSDVINGACFIAGTLVLTSKGYVPIENIDAGDKVWAENPETGEKELKEVVQTFVNETDELVHVFVDGEEIVTTPEHPFYAPCKGWTEAIQLRAGDILVLQSGEYVIVEKVQHEILEAPITVYNFEVEDFHTYYVSVLSVLVHNSCFVKHGNSLETTKPAQGYILRDIDTHEILKYGETTRGTKRYSQKYLKKHNAYMDFVVSGTKAEMHKWQHNKIVNYVLISGQRPPLNKSLY